MVRVRSKIPATSDAVHSEESAPARVRPRNSWTAKANDGAALAAPTAGAARWETNRDELRRHIAQHPVEDISAEELDAHFDGMPPRYWERVNESELVWGLQSVHRFLHGVVASPSADTPVVVNWRYFPEEG